MGEKESLTNYFYLGEELNYPIYLKVQDQAVPKEIVDMILSFGFKALDEERSKEIESVLREREDSRVLDIRCASPDVRLQLSRIQESDLYGFESIIPQNGYNVYRYKDGGVLVFSSSANIWKLGCWTGFKEGDDLKKAYNIILNRFVSWAFVEHGVIGFWGRILGKEIELLKQKESNGEAFYVDTEKNVAFNFKGELLSIQNVDIVREERGVVMAPNKKKRAVSKERFISLLFGSCTFFDLKGLSVRVREMIVKIAKTQCGYIKPKSKDGSARDLSL
ncbi:MAG: hypothetical protein VXW15_12405 [Bdellovibrionota bacterium]|nr:hypothetical protein [Bdellovibrionota bacterium]